MLHGLPAHFQQQALLGVHEGGFARGNAEEAGVETGDVADGAGGEGIRRAWVVLGRVQVSVGGPAVFGNAGHKVAAFQQRWPVAVYSGAGESER